jgi:hypothetical protein
MICSSSTAVSEEWFIYYSMLAEYRTIIGLQKHIVVVSILPFWYQYHYYNSAACSASCISKNEEVCVLLYCNTFAVAHWSVTLLHLVFFRTKQHIKESILHMQRQARIASSKSRTQKDTKLMLQQLRLGAVTDELECCTEALHYCHVITANRAHFSHRS